MDTNFFAKVQLLGDELHGTLNGLFAHGGFGHADDCFSQTVIATVGWEQKRFVLMCGPILA